MRGASKRPGRATAPAEVFVAWCADCGPVGASSTRKEASRWTCGNFPLCNGVVFATKYAIAKITKVVRRAR